MGNARFHAARAARLDVCDEKRTSQPARARFDRRYSRVWPDPVTTYLVEVISGRPTGRGMQLLSGDSNLGAEPKFTSVDEPA